MDVILIRHGKTEANERHLYCGSTDVSLSKTGIDELRALHSQCAYPPVSGMLIHTSGMLRADQTLEVLYGNVPRTPIPGMRELDFGEFEMHSYDELKEIPEYVEWISDQTGEMPCPGGESSAIFKNRVFAAFDALTAAGQNALVICHGGVISQLMARLFPNEGKNFYEWQPSAGRGYIIRLDGAHPISYAPVPAAK